MALISRFLSKRDAPAISPAISPVQLFWSPQGARVQARLHFGKLEARAAPALAKPIDLAPG